MPKLYTDHRSDVRLERELAEIWDVLDKLGVREGRLRALTRGAPGGPAPLLTLQGDLLTRDASQDAVIRAGADNEILTADAAEAVGMKWSSSLADHLAETLNPHGSTMQVAARLITQEVYATVILGITVNFSAADSVVVINNDDATKKCSLDVEKDIIVGGTVDGRDVDADGTKLDTVETNADVTDAANVATAGAVMDGDFGESALMVRTGAGAYTNRSIVVGSAKLTISNGDGVSGNPSLDFGSVAVADLSDVASKTGTGTEIVFSASPTIVTPTIASFVNATHDHQSDAKGGTLDAAAIAAGTLADARIAAKYRTETAVFFIGTIENPVLITAPALPIAMVPKGATLKFARYQCNGTDTPTVTFNIRKHDDDAPFTPGVVLWSSDKTATATTASTTSFTSPAVTARQTLWVDVSNVSGTPKTLFLTLEWEYD